MRNNNMILFKNLPSDKLFLIFFVRLFLDAIAAIKFMMDGGIRNLWAVAKAHWNFFALIPSLYRERQSASQRATSKIYQKNMVVEHYIKGKKILSELEPENFS